MESELISIPERIRLLAAFGAALGVVPTPVVAEPPDAETELELRTQWPIFCRAAGELGVLPALVCGWTEAACGILRMAHDARFVSQLAPVIGCNPADTDGTVGMARAIVAFVLGERPGYQT